MAETQTVALDQDIKEVKLEEPMAQSSDGTDTTNANTNSERIEEDGKSIEEQEEKDENNKDDEDGEDDNQVACTNAENTNPEIDPFAYLQREEFTSEIFKIEINNLPHRFGVGQLRKKLIAMGLKPVKLKVMQRCSFAFVNFRCEEDRQEAMEKIEGHRWKGKVMRVKKANPAADPLAMKRKQEADATGSEPKSKVARNDDEPETSVIDRLNQAVSPLWQMDYNDQLKTKQAEVTSFLKKLGHQIERNNQDDDMKSHLKQMYRTNKGLCCNMQPIKPSPVLNNYRNKCELTIGQSPEGIDKIVGFRLGRYKGGTLSVVEADECVIIPKKMKICAKSLQKFLQTESVLPGFDPETKAGNWKMALLRMNQMGDVLLAVVIHPQKLEEAEIQREQKNLERYYTEGEGRDIPITSLYFLEESDRKSHEQNPRYILLKGNQHIEEDLLDLRFRISPGAFFQVNTPAAAVLYKTIGDWCSVSQNTVLLDVCCGTGTIGLTMAKKVKKVVGIEMCKEAVADAKANASLNNIENVEFYRSKAEDILPYLIWRHSRDDVVAVVDPPRAGLHPDVIRTIRKCEFVDRLIYVSCKPTGALNNLVDLTRSESRRVRGKPFKLVQAVPIDLFPHTSHSELVMMFTRPKPAGKPSGNPSEITKATDSEKEVNVTDSDSFVSDKNSSLSEVDSSEKEVKAEGRQDGEKDMNVTDSESFVSDKKSSLSEVDSTEIEVKVEGRQEGNMCH